MDAGPVLAQEASSVDDIIQAPELLSQLFQQGAQLLLQNLPLVASGKAAEAAHPQVCSCSFVELLCLTPCLIPSCGWHPVCSVTEQDTPSSGAPCNSAASGKHTPPPGGCQ